MNSEIVHRQGDSASQSTTDQRPARRSLIVSLAVVSALLVVVASVLATLLLAGRFERPQASAAAPTPTPSETPPPTTEDVFGVAAPSVVIVRSSDGALGTGTVVAADGTILTAAHVVDDGSTLSITFADGTETPATVTASDPARDIATLAPQRMPEVLVPATIGGAAPVGDDVVAIGNPLGLSYSVSTGVVSGVNRSTGGERGRLEGLIQFDAAVNPGSSGGPLLDGNGLLIGVVIAIADPGGDEAFAGIGFAVPIGAALGGNGEGEGPGGPQI